MPSPEQNRDQKIEGGWDGLARWWLSELERDVAYGEVADLALSLMGDPEGGYVIDVGCGDGRFASHLAGSTVMGIDLDWSLLKIAARSYRGVVRARLPSLAAFRTDGFDGALVSLVLEHLDDHYVFLEEIGRVVRKGGFLVLVVNHPIFTAPESAPIQDTDGEVLWRPGRYFSSGFTDERAGEGVIRFHHRTIGELLSAAADAGWGLVRLIEMGPLPSQIETTPTLSDQLHIPRLMAVRWERR